MNERRLTPKEVALRLGVTEKCLEKWRGALRGPQFMKLAPRVVRYREADVEAWEATRVVATSGK